MRETKKILNEKIDTTRKARIDKMNTHLNRVIAGQSPDLPLAVRMDRVKIACEKHGWADLLKDIVLPLKGFKRYL